MIGTRARFAVAVAAVLALTAAGSALAVQAPGRSIVRSGPVQLVALDHASLAFVVGRSRGDCDHVELWNTDAKQLWRFGRPGACTNLGSTGTGISALGVSGDRALWVHYTGGNLRDWELMTATSTQKAPRRLRFVEQDVELPSPFSIGDSTADLGIPYAAGRLVVLLGTNGAAVFKHTDPSAITAVTAGRGPGGAVVAALRATGEVVLLRRDGSIAWTAPFAAGAVKAIALAPVGLVAQVGTSVQVVKPSGTATTLALPSGARLTDYAEGRILYTLRGDVRVRKVSSGAEALLLHAPGTTPPPASLDTHGLGWGHGRTISFACASCLVG